MHSNMLPNRRPSLRPARGARPALAAVLLAGLTLAATAATAEQLRFQVYLDDRPIGEHSFRIADSGKTTRVTSRAAFAPGTRVETDVRMGAGRPAAIGRDCTPRGPPGRRSRLPAC